MATSPNDLPGTGVRAASDFAGDLASVRSQPELEALVRLLPQLTDADTMILGWVSPRRAGEPAPARVDASGDPSGFFDDSARAAYAEWAHEQPLVRSHYAGPAPLAMRVSDFLSAGEWQRTNVYNECYRRMGLGWEIVAQLHCSGDSIGCAELQRADHDFSELDRALLDVLTPHLRAAYARVRSRAGDERRLALLEQGLEERGEGLFAVGRDGHVAAAGPRARTALHDWFGTPHDHTALPDPVWAWWEGVRSLPAPPTLVLTQQRRELALRLVPREDADLVVLRDRVREA
jgi:hypothetical protein